MIVLDTNVVSELMRPAPDTAARERGGRPIDALDAQIAAICRTHSAPLATRKTRDFVGTGVELLDPWRA